MPLVRTPSGNLLFIHIPKTGGTSVERHLAGSFDVELIGRDAARKGPCKLQHYHGALLEEALKDVPVAMSFMIVRHPVDRIVSEFKFQTRKPTRFWRGLSFSRWLRRNLARTARDPFNRDNHFRPQVEFEAFGPAIFRFEEGLQPCFQWLQEKIGLPPPAADIHVWKSRDRKVDVSGDDLEAIRAFYKADFDRYGYAP